MQAERRYASLFGARLRSIGRVSLVNGLCVVTAALFILPFVQMAVNSLKSNNEILSNPVGLPINLTVANYLRVLNPANGLLPNFFNSIIISTASTTFAVTFCAVAAFAFSKLRFAGRNTIFVFFLGTMMIPPEVTLPGQFLLFAKFDLINTLSGQILPTITPVIGLFLMRQYMNEIPDDVIDAARIDGASTTTLFLRIVLPMSLPIVSAYAVLQFLSEWNDYLWPSLVATKADVKTFMVAVPEIVDPIIGAVPAYGTIFAGCAISVFPVLLVFLFFREKIMSSVTIGAFK